MFQLPQHGRCFSKSSNSFVSQVLTNCHLTRRRILVGTCHEVVAMEVFTTPCHFRHGVCVVFGSNQDGQCSAHEVWHLIWTESIQGVFTHQRGDGPSWDAMRMACRKLLLKREMWGEVRRESEFAKSAVRASGGRRPLGSVRGDSRHRGWATKEPPLPGSWRAGDQESGVVSSDVLRESL